MRKCTLNVVSSPFNPILKLYIRFKYSSICGYINKYIVLIKKIYVRQSILKNENVKSRNYNSQRIKEIFWRS